MKLTEHEILNPVWIKVRDYYMERLESLRARNDGDMDETKTANMRGRIAEIKALLDMENEAPLILE